MVTRIKLSLFNGFEAAAAIRQMFSSAPPLLIAVSGALASVRAADAGSAFDHAFTKPLDFDALFRVLFRE